MNRTWLPVVLLVLSVITAAACVRKDAALGTQSYAAMSAIWFLDNPALAPEADRLVLFASELVPHQVKPTRGGDALRVAVTLWYCDYDELLAAEADDEPRGQTPTEMAALAAIAARRRET